MLCEEQLGLAARTPAAGCRRSRGTRSSCGSMFFRLRRYSHCPAKLVDERLGLRIGQHASDLLLAARPACAACPARRRCSSSSSGMLLHRKNDSRDASSRSLSGYTVPGAALAGSRSTRNTNFGLASMRCSASWMPRSKFPSRRPVAIERHQPLRCRRRWPARDRRGARASR